MAEDRPLEDTTERLQRVTQDLEDFKSTMLARASRRPTGDIEDTLRATPKIGTLICDGAIVSRTTYADLWKWAQTQQLVGVWFTTGDGSTTFGLPDFRDRAKTGASSTRPVGTKYGSQTKTLTEANLAPHDHDGRTGVDDPGHEHYVGGNHGGHRPVQAPGVGGSGAAWPTTAESFSGDAGWSSGANRAHGHNFRTSTAGSGTPINVESPAASTHTLIWT